MAKQSANIQIPALPDVPRNSGGFPDGNPSREPELIQATWDGHAVSPAVARSRGSAAVGQGHGGGGAK
jgi:hypothetical protein